MAVPAFAADTSKRIHVKLACRSDNVRVRVFDATGKLLADETIPLDKMQREFVVPDRLSATPAERFVTTSASKGCVQGSPGKDKDTNAAINTFDMPCNSDPPIDLVLTSDPRARFTVHRQVLTVIHPAPCRWDDSGLFHGSSVDFFTSDQKLVIEAVAESGNMHGYLELDWSSAPNEKPRIKKNPGRPGQNGGARAPNADTISPPLKSITVTKKAHR